MLRQPRVEAGEIPKAAFASGPALSPETVSVTAVSDLIVGSKAVSEQAAAAFARELFAHRQAILREIPDTASIEKPDTEKDAASGAAHGIGRESGARLSPARIVQTHDDVAPSDAIVGKIAEQGGVMERVGKTDSARLASLDLLRLVAALAVVPFHYLFARRDRRRSRRGISCSRTVRHLRLSRGQSVFPDQRLRSGKRRRRATIDQEQDERRRRVRRSLSEAKAKTDRTPNREPAISGQITSGCN